MPPPEPNQTLISNFFLKSTIPNSNLNVEHVLTFEENEDEVIVRNRQKKRCIEDDKENVPDEVTIMAHAKKIKYEDTSFYQLINSFLQKSSNTFVPIPKVIIIKAKELLSNALPNVTKSQAENIIKKCAMQCRGGINMKNGGKPTISSK